MNGDPVGSAKAEEPQPKTGEPQPEEAAGSMGERRLRLAGWLFAIAAVLFAGTMLVVEVGPPSEAELREQAGLIGKKSLRIGVKYDTPGIARVDSTGEVSGFDIDIALLIAADLGFRPDQVEFLEIETEDRARMRAKNRQGEYVTVDLVVATFSVTPERRAEASVGFSTPYLHTEQSVVTLAGHPPISSLHQLRGKKVCTLGTSTSESELVKAGAEVTGMNRISECMEGLENGDYEAVSTDAAILAGFVAESDGKLAHFDIGLAETEMWAVNTGSNTALGTLVELALYRSYADPQDQRWEEAYKKHIGPLLKANPGIDVAGSEQPCVNEPDVRRWPWEYAVSTPPCQR
ncbi:transporter substrate-binding domain-containing protein [Thermostaphylospora chromogena]|uniref:Glutamate transport system substrate-binding protein n=1 Tax=Thermostaphylospora chromogena TaxID=35622 RepID=A0A1H1FPZ7_9ACTN|nr:transporter substrate-binding domain-containing protein [Thermostaphylospora chromogena]SDR02997.1 glutamate transport system substrate-binding protein [Thermostaphylospora chromogena]